MIIRLFEDGVIENMDQIVFNILLNPANQMATIMPENALHIAIENTQKGIDYLIYNNHNPQKLESAVSWLQSNHNYDRMKFESFVNYNKRLDKIRNTSFEKMYPEYCDV